MKVIIAGGRDFADWQVFADTMYRVREAGIVISEVFCGCAPGADTMGEHWAGVLLRDPIPVRRFPADWDRYRAGAGPIRNQVMVDAGADGLIAFPGGAGTADMVRRAVAGGLWVWAVADPRKRKGAPGGLSGQGASEGPQGTAGGLFAEKAPQEG